MSAPEPQRATRPDGEGARTGSSAEYEKRCYAQWPGAGTIGTGILLCLAVGCLFAIDMPQAAYAGNTGTSLVLLGAAAWLAGRATVEACMASVIWHDPEFADQGIVGRLHLAWPSLLVAALFFALGAVLFSAVVLVSGEAGALRDANRAMLDTMRHVAAWALFPFRGTP